jgi:hypothetical protein
MTHLGVTCGTQSSDHPPERCPICEDERQPFPFTQQYGAWPNFIVPANAKEVIRRSAVRLCAHWKKAHRGEIPLREVPGEVLRESLASRWT